MESLTPLTLENIRTYVSDQVCEQLVVAGVTDRALDSLSRPEGTTFMTVANLSEEETTLHNVCLAWHFNKTTKLCNRTTDDINGIFVRVLRPENIVAVQFLKSQTYRLSISRGNTAVKAIDCCKMGLLFKSLRGLETKASVTFDVPVTELKQPLRIKDFFGEHLDMLPVSIRRKLNWTYIDWIHVAVGVSLIVIGSTMIAIVFHRALGRLAKDAPSSIPTKSTQSIFPKQPMATEIA